MWMKISIAVVFYGERKKVVRIKKMDSMTDPACLVEVGGGGGDKDESCTFQLIQDIVLRTRKHSSRMRTDRAVTRMTSDRVAIRPIVDRQTPVKTLPSLAVGNDDFAENLK